MTDVRTLNCTFSRALLGAQINQRCKPVLFYSSGFSKNNPDTLLIRLSDETMATFVTRYHLIFGFGSERAERHAARRLTSTLNLN